MEFIRFYGNGSKLDKHSFLFIFHTNEKCLCVSFIHHYYYTYTHLNHSVDKTINYVRYLPIKILFEFNENIKYVITCKL